MNYNKSANQLSKSVLFSCFFAGCLEMYDFVIFGMLASVINKHYLSFLEDSGMIAAYMLFAVGFICRPIGSIIFGHIGDRYGRKKALVLSVSAMGFSSLALSILPVYKDIGIISCYILIIIRIIQGISVGGEYSGAAIYAIEHTNKSNIGVVGSTVLAGTTLGVLAATFVSNILENPALPDYSWRFAFLLGFGLSIVGYFIRNKLGESPLFIKEKQKTKKSPLFYGINNYKKQFFAAILLSGANNANYYFALVFIPNYLKSEYVDSIGFSSLALPFFMLFLEPTFGWMSDKFSRNKILIAVFLGLAIYNLFFIDLLVTYLSSTFGVAFIIIGAMLVSIPVSLVNIFVLEIFPTSCRYSCGALSYSIGAAIFGGTTPVVCSLISTHIGNNPIYYGAYISLVSLLGAAGGIVLMNKKSSYVLSQEEYEENKTGINLQTS